MGRLLDLIQKGGLSRLQLRLQLQKEFCVELLRSKKLNAADTALSRGERLFAELADETSGMTNEDAIERVVSELTAIYIEGWNDACEVNKAQYETQLINDAIKGTIIYADENI